MAYGEKYKEQNSMKMLCPKCNHPLPYIPRGWRSVKCPNCKEEVKGDDQK